MALDSYRARNLDQVENDSQKIDEIEQIKLDPDLKAKLREAKKNLEMEKALLERQNEKDKMVSELNLASKRNMDSISLSDINLNSSYNNNYPIQQEENIADFGPIYSEEEKQRAQEEIQRNLKSLEDLFTILDDKISEYNVSDSLDEEQTTKYR